MAVQIVIALIFLELLDEMDYSSLNDEFGVIDCRNIYIKEFS